MPKQISSKQKPAAAQSKPASPLENARVAKALLHEFYSGKGQQAATRLSQLHETERSSVTCLALARVHLINGVHKATQVGCSVPARLAVPALPRSWVRALGSPRGALTELRTCSSTADSRRHSALPRAWQARYESHATAGGWRRVVQVGLLPPAGRENAGCQRRHTILQGGASRAHSPADPSLPK